ncbi:A disintegrin and metallo ase with thrombospondin motifs 20 [Labeo rohita]|uniref:A disintegrin and metallo ase with thrombospondin motifs 20 n=1 Tax=Labeo rohita TaxID=84645 RepID=A0A498NY21_LABRO|nr:A disintegrin and metallo ase with thrombospondin motifs 20 [Labeo rohita]
MSYVNIGTFTTHGGQFFLEPLLSADGDEYEEEHNKPHLLYRHDANRKSHDTRPCSASEFDVQIVNAFNNINLLQL